MSEADEVSMLMRDEQLAQAVAMDGRMAGDMLRKMREDADVSAEVVASAMKVPLSKLLALENGDFNELPDLTFARGLASAICRGFGVDPEPVLAQMPMALPELHVSDTAVNQPLNRSSDRPPPIVSSLPAPVLIAAAVLLIVAAALWLLPTLPIQLGAPQESAVTTPPPAPAPTPAPAPAPDDNAQAERQKAAAAEPVAEPATATAKESVSAGVVLAAVPVAAPVAVPVAVPVAAPVPVTAVSEPAAAVASASPSDVLGFTANAETWVSVRDAHDKMLLNRTLSAGDTLSVDGKLPLSVTIGRKSAVAVTVRGKPRKFRGSSEVARFLVE
jgi:cytoskeleton protein RodZ